MKHFILLLFSILILVSILDKRNEKKALKEAAALEFQMLQREKSKDLSEGKKREGISRFIVLILFFVAIKLALY